MNDFALHEFATTAETLGVDPALGLATVYRRVVNASLTRIWENVFDWEHLPVLHDTYFNAVDLLDRHPDGWRVRLSRQPGNAERVQVLELSVDRANSRYRVRTLEGTGQRTEIWTQLKVLAPNATAIEVRYYLPEHAPDKVGVLGEKYRSSCQQLWTEDEAMMMHRESMLDRLARADFGSETESNAPAAPATLALGSLRDVRARLPLQVDFGGHPFRIVDVDGELIAHSTVCPHWLGPLDQVPLVDGCVSCPWHGYRFDVRTGASADGRALALRRAPVVAVDDVTDRVMLIAVDEVTDRVMLITPSPA